MRKRFWKITSAVAAVSIALALGVNSAFATSVSDSADSGIVVIDEEAMAKANSYAEAYEKVYEKALQEEIDKIDFEEHLNDVFNNQNQRSFIEDPHVIARENAQKRAEEECERLGLSAGYKLTPLINAPYPGWQGNFGVESIEGTKLTFTTPDFFSCVIDGRKGTIDAKYGYTSNFKWVTVDLTYSDGTTSHKHYNGNIDPLSCTADAKSGTIVNARYEFAILKGTEVAADYLEVAFITLYLA